MSIFQRLKSIFNDATTKVELVVQKSVSPKERFQKAALDLSDKIDEFQKSEIRINREIRKVTSQIYDHSNEGDKISKLIKLKIEQGEEVPPALYKLGYTRELIVENLKAKKAQYAEAVAVIPENVVKLDAKRSEIMLNIELINLNQVSDELGLTLPEDITSSVDISVVDIDTMLVKTEIIHGESATSIDTAGLELYKSKFSN